MAKAHSSIRAAARENVGGPARLPHRASRASRASRITYHASRITLLFQRLRQLLHTVCEVRREDHRDDRVALQSERQALQQEKWNRIEACQQAGPADSRALEAALAALIESSRSPRDKAKQG